MKESKNQKTGSNQSDMIGNKSDVHDGEIEPSKNGAFRALGIKNQTNPNIFRSRIVCCCKCTGCHLREIASNVDNNQGCNHSNESKQLTEPTSTGA